MYNDYLLYLIAVLIISFSQILLSSNYQKHRKTPTVHGIRGAEVAEYILKKNGIYDVTIEPSNRGTLSDYYDPTRKVVCLSSDIYYNSSIASVAVAAHEVGHALQHAQGYSLIAIRNKLLPLTQIASQLGWYSLLIGLIFTIDPLFWVGVVSLFIILLFQLVTLPIEFNASSRAIDQLTSLGIIELSEVKSTRSVLNAAAFTYVASLISILLQIIRIFMRKNRRRS